MKADIASLEKELHDLKKWKKRFVEEREKFDKTTEKWFDALEHHAGIDCENYPFKAEGKPPADDPYRAVREAFEKS